MITSEIILLPEGHSWIEFGAIPDDLRCSEEKFQQLLDLKPSTRGKVVLFNKEIDVPRWQQSFGTDYWFSGLNHNAEKITNQYMKDLLQFVQSHSGEPYEQILVNWYLDGREYIGAHSDDESQLVKNSAIYSFSFGSKRDFIITSKKDKNFRLAIPLKNNDIIIMGGEMQKYYKHSVPKRLRITEPRINITMRLYDRAKSNPKF